MKTIAAIGVGNFLRCDEGAGIHAIEHLESCGLPENIELIDGGTPGLSIMYLIEHRELVIIIDCADFGGEPGEVKIFNHKDLLRDDNTEISLHATDLLSSLELAKKLGENIPEKIFIIGIQPKTTEPGTKLSEEVSKSLDEIPGKIGAILK